MGKIILPIEEIIEKWENGIVVQEIEKEYKVSYRTIYRRINEYYKGKIKPKIERTNLKIELPIEEIIEKWENGVTQEELAQEYEVSLGTIGRRINEYYNGKTKPHRKIKGIKGRPKIELPIEEIIEKWEKGVTKKELAQKYEV